jgi:hypothetical protein
MAQKIDNTIAFRDIKSDSYFRFNYENDYFGSTDKNYTQGYNLELVLPIFKKNPVNNLFLNFKDSNSKYGLSIEHIGYTPNKYELSEIQYDDRPFASAIMLKSFMISTDTIHKSRFTSSLNIGIIGPGAFGEEMQVGIHQATGNIIPKGWHNQIKNDAVINYEMGYEKQIIKYKKLFTLQTNANLKVGTLFTNASIGLNSTIGLITDAFSNSKNKFNLYFYTQPIVSVIGYDATLQGGLFNKKSTYTIQSKAIERFTAQYNYGFILKTRTLFFEYSRSAITKEYSFGNSAKWGGIRIGFTF